MRAEVLTAQMEQGRKEERPRLHCFSQCPKPTIGVAELQLGRHPQPWQQQRMDLLFGQLLTPPQPVHMHTPVGWPRR
jgi:hypothetical protein